MNDLEHGWVLTVDRDWAEHCGADTWLEKKCPGDDCIADFVWEKNLNTELARRLTVEEEPEAVYAALVDMLRNTTEHRRTVEREEYELVSDHYAAEFERWMDDRERGAQEP